MTLMSRSCRIAQDQIVAVLAGSVDPRDRRALDAHAARCYRCAEALRDAVATHVALGRAFAPLRAAHTLVAPGRVRLALRPAPARPGPFAELFGLGTRPAEATVALGVSAFILSSAVAGMAPSEPARPPAGPSDGVAVHLSRRLDDNQFFYRR